MATPESPTPESTPAPLGGQSVATPPAPKATKDELTAMLAGAAAIEKSIADLAATLAPLDVRFLTPIFNGAGDRIREASRYIQGKIGAAGK